jgi:hypothetical protein
MCHRVILLLAGGWLLLAVDLRANCPELVGHLPGPISAVAVSGDYAYLGGAAGFMVADVSDPAAPRVVGEVGIPLGVRDIAVSGGYAFLACGLRGDGGLQVVDVSTPSAPVEVGFINTPGPTDGVAVSGFHAYLAGDYGLRVIDVSVPSTPVEVGSIDTPDSASAVAVEGSYAYVAAGEYGDLRVIDVSAPSAPVEVGHADQLGAALGVAVDSGYAFVANSDSGLLVIDVSNPFAPIEVGSVRTHNARRVAVAQGFAYVADGGRGLRIINVSTPQAPAIAGSVDTPGFAQSAAVAVGHAYVADYVGGLRVIDVGTPSAPAEIGSVDTLWEVWNLAASNGLAYAVGDNFHVIDVSTPSAPFEVGRVEVADVNPGGPVAVSGDYAYVIKTDDDEAHMHVIDLDPLSSAVQVPDYLGTALIAKDIAVLGSYVYVAIDEQAGLSVVDASAPLAPFEEGFLSLPGSPSGVAVSGGHAYVAAGEAGLRVIDVSLPSAPVEAGFTDTSALAHSVVVSGRYAYVGFDPSGFGVVDVSDPTAPVEVACVETPGRVEAVAVSGSYAYLAWYDWESDRGGLRAIDVRVPFALVDAGSYDTPGQASDVAVSDGYVYLTDGPGGLFAFSECREGPTPDGRVSFIPAAAVAAGAQGAFFQTDVEINNTGAEEAQLTFQWLPRGEDNSEPTQTEPIALAAGQSVRYENVLATAFGLGPDSLGALKLMATTESVIGLSRTYNIPAGKTAGTFGQGLPAIRATEMIAGTEPQRIIFLSENDDSRANVGCVNGSSEPLRINIGVFDAEGSPLETRTMDLGPWSNNQINRVFRDYQPVNGYVDVWADSDDALYYCYGSMLDNLTSDPTTILPQVPSDDISFIPAAALAAGLEGAFFSTDVDLNNVGSTDITYELLWLPRGEDNSDPVTSETFSLAPGAGVRYANVLDEVFGLEPDQVGALAVEASSIDLLAMSRTYNLPSAKVAGTFGQELPGIPADRLITSEVKKRIIFMNENDDVRANVGCQNGSEQTVRVFIELFNAEGESLETKTIDLTPYSNNQITRVFRDHAPISAGYVDVWTATPGAFIYCYGSVLDNLTSDPTTVLPQ